MKRILFLITALLCFCILLVACDNQSKNDYAANNEAISSTLSQSTILNAAKQKVVDEICSENGVRQISIIYSKEAVERGVGEWRVKLQGTYRLVYSDGDLGNSRQFNCTVDVDENGRATHCSGSFR